MGIKRKLVCDFLLVVNSNRHPISCRFGVIAAYCCVLSHRWGGGLGTTYDGHLGLVGKRVVDFLLNFFSSGVMADALREN